MAISFRSVAGVHSVAAGAGLTCDKPAGTVEDDVLVAAVVLGDQRTITAPLGWTHLLTSDATSGPRLAIYYKVAGGAEPASYAWSWSDLTVAAVETASYDGVDTAAPVDTSAGGADSGSSGATVVAPSVTTTAAMTRLLAVFGTGTTAATQTFSTPSGMTARGGAVGVAANSSWAHLFDEVRPSAAATGTRTSTIGTSTRWVTASIALKPANTAPNAPTVTTMTGGAVIDLANTNRADWDFSDPDVGDSQSKFDLRYRLVGAGSWTDVTSTTPNTFHDFAGGTFTAGNYEWQVRTYDALGEVGPYSASSFFTAAETPDTPTITAPVNGATITAEDGSVTWSTPTQTSYQVRKVADSAGSPDTGTVYYDSGEVASSVLRSAALTFPTNDRVEHLQVRIKADGLWSSWASVSVTVDYTEPATPTIALDDVSTAGAIVVQATHPTPAGLQPTVSSVDVYRREVGDSGEGIRVAAAGAASAAWTDWAVASGVSYEYRVRAWGDNGTSAYSDWESDGSGETSVTVDGGEVGDGEFGFDDGGWPGDGVTDFESGGLVSA